MSAVIRLQLATVLATLKDKGRAVLASLNANDTTVDEDARLEAEAVQLRGAARRAQAFIDKWYGVIARLLPTQQQEEMDILQAFPPPRGEVREDDEPTALAQIEHSYELVDLVNVCLQQRRVGNRGSVSSRRTEKSVTVGKEQTDNARHQAHHTQANGQESYSPEHPDGFTRRPPQTRINEQQAAGTGNGTSAHHTNSASQAGFSPYQQQGIYNGAPIYSTFKLFRLEPMKFAGDPKEWTAFWLAFDRAVNSQPLPPFEKHLCLLQSLVPGSAARRAIDGYPPSDENYPMVVSILRRQFGDGKALREGLIAELLHLPLANNSLFSLRNLYEHVERICLQLESPEGSNATQDEIVCGIIRSKLPHEALETLIGWEEDENAEWTLAQLRKGLGRLVQLKERLELTITTLRPNKLEQPTMLEEHPHYNQSTERSDHHEPTDVSYSCMTTQSPGPLDGQHELPARPPQSPIEYGCSLCNTGSTHKPSRCPMFNSRNRRKARLLEQRRCLNCLYDGHMLNRCRAANKCRRCGGRHHFMLCFQRQPKRRHHDGSYEANCTQRQPKKRVYYPTGQHDGPSSANWRQSQSNKFICYYNGHHDGPYEANWRQPQFNKRVYYRTGHHEGPSEANWRVPTPPQSEVTYSGMVFTSSLSDSKADTKSSSSSTVHNGRTNRHRRRKVWINSKLKANLLKSKNGQETPPTDNGPNSSNRSNRVCSTCSWLINKINAGSTAPFKCSSMHFLLMLALILLARWCKQQVFQNAQLKPLQSAITFNDGTTEAATDQTSTSFSNAGKFLCVTQAVTTEAVTCGITAATTEGVTESATEQIARNCSIVTKINLCATRTGTTRAA
uniref:CCHC-type domain-containing protein n=1 Tax=Meloidogyne floridensis TaxID=298350 RepID=A0A915NWI0_9BILA